MNTDMEIHELRKKVKSLEDENQKLRERIKSLEAEINRIKPVNPRQGA